MLEREEHAPICGVQKSVDINVIVKVVLIVVQRLPRRNTLIQMLGNAATFARLVNDARDAVVGGRDACLWGGWLVHDGNQPALAGRHGGGRSSSSSRSQRRRSVGLRKRRWILRVLLFL